MVAWKLGVNGVFDLGTSTLHLECLEWKCVWEKNKFYEQSKAGQCKGETCKSCKKLTILQEEKIVVWMCYICMVTCNVKLSHMHVTMLGTIDHVLGHIGKTYGGPLSRAGGIFFESLNDLHESFRNWTPLYTKSLYREKQHLRNVFILSFSI